MNKQFLRRSLFHYLSEIHDTDMVGNMTDDRHIVVEKIGFPFEQTSVFQAENRSHFIGDSQDPDGNTWIRTIGFARSPHWPSQVMARLTWEFLQQFAVDPKTGISHRL